MIQLFSRLFLVALISVPTGTAFARNHSAVLEVLAELPSEIHLLNRQDVQADWEKLQISLPASQNYSAISEYDVIRQLNLSAIEISESLGLTQSNLPSFRDSYQRGKFPGNRSERKQQREKIRNFRAEINTFMATTYVPIPTEQSAQAPNIRFHPLLAQVILQLVSEMKIFPFIEKGPGVGWRLLAVLNDREAMSWQGEQRALRIHQEFKTNFIPLKNALRWLLLGSDRDCLTWGFWPQAASGILKALEVNSQDRILWSEQIGQGSFRDLDSKYAFSNHAHVLARNLSTKHHQACPSLADPTQMDEFKHEEHLKHHDWIQHSSVAWWIDVVKAFREISSRY